MHWRPFDLHPEYPPEGIARAALERRYGSHFTDGVHRMIEEAGLPVTSGIERVPNSRASLIVSELGRDRRVYRPLQRAIFAAYWSEGRDIGDRDVLAELAGQVGIERPDVEAALDAERALPAIVESTQQAVELGATGVPAWVIDRRVLIPGAQPHEMFARVLEKLGHEPLEQAPAG